MTRFDGVLSPGLRHMLEDCQVVLAGGNLPPDRRAYVLADLRGEMDAASGFIARASGDAVLAASDVPSLRSATWLLGMLPHLRPQEVGRRAGALAAALGAALGEGCDERFPAFRQEAAAFLGDLLEAVRGRELLGDCRGRA